MRWKLDYFVDKTPIESVIIDVPNEIPNHHYFNNNKKFVCKKNGVKYNDVYFKSQKLETVNV